MNNIQLAHTIKTLCKSHKITVKSLLEGCNINRNFMYALEKKAQAPSIEVVESIANYLDCSVDYLLGRTNNPEINRSIDPANELSYTLPPKQAKMNIQTVQEDPVYTLQNRIPVLGKVAAGTPILSYSSDFGNIIPESRAASYALIVQGDSMYPIILDGEYIEVTNQPELEQGEIGIIMVDGDVTCKKFYDFSDHYELRSINPDYATITVPKSSSTNLQILGKVSLTEDQMKRF